MFFWLFSMASSTVSRATRDRANRLHILKRKMFSFIIFISEHDEQFLRRVRDAPRNSGESMEMMTYFAAYSTEAMIDNNNWTMRAISRHAHAFKYSIVFPQSQQLLSPIGSTSNCRGASSLTCHLGNIEPKWLEHDDQAHQILNVVGGP